MTHILPKRLWMSLGCLSGLILAPAGQAAPLGPPIMVNTVSPGDQSPSHFAAGANGEKLLIWTDEAAKATYAQRIRSSGTPYLSKHQIQTPPNYSNLSVDRAGNFLLAGDLGTVMAYDRNGNLLSSFRPTPDSLKSNAIMDTDGNITVAYSYPNVLNAPRTLAIRRFNTSGAPISPEVIVASGAAELLYGPSAMAADNAGNIALSWSSRSSPSEKSTSIMMQRFNRTGVALAPAFVVSQRPNQYVANMAMEPGGRAVIAWSVSFPGERYDTYYVYAAAYDANGNRTGGTQVSQRMAKGPPDPNAAISENGDFVVSWVASEGVAGGPGGYALVARQFRSDATLIGKEFRIDPPESHYATASPVLAMDSVGNFAVSWLSNSAGNGWETWVRPFKLDTRPPITQLLNKQPAQGLAGDTDSWTYHRLTVPPGVRQLNIDMTGPVGGGDGDMYVRFGALPSLTAWDQRPYVNGSNESIGISNPPPGDVYIAIHGRSAYSSVGLTAGYYYP